MIGTGIDEPREAREEPAGDGWGPSDGGFATSQRQWSLVTIAAGGQMKRESERARAREGGCASRDDLVSVHRSQCMVCVYGHMEEHGAWSLVKWHKTHKCMLVAAELAANVAIAHRTRNGARLAPRPPTKHQRSKAAVDGAASLRVSLSAVREAKAVVVWANQGSAHPCVTGPEAFTHTLPPLGALFGRYNTPFTSSPFALHSPASALHTHTHIAHAAAQSVSLSPCSPRTHPHAATEDSRPPFRHAPRSRSHVVCHACGPPTRILPPNVAMPMWPFGRRGGKATRIKEGGPVAAAVAERQRPAAGSMPALRAHEFANRDVLRSSPARRQSTRSARRRRKSSRASASSLHDFEKDSPSLKPLEAQAHAAFAKEQGLPRHSVDDDITALPNQRRLEHSPHLRPISQQRGTIPYNFDSHENDSLSSLPTARERGRLQRPQSLRKPAYESSGLVRHLSTKKSKREHENLREEEIRAMSMPLPQKRPAGRSGDMLRRDSKKVKGTMNRRFERPESNISLPPEDSIHSSMSGSSDPRAFRVSALDMFSPRPTVRCSVGSQHYASGPDSSPLSNKSKTTAPRGRQPGSRDGSIERKDFDEKRAKRSSRIDDLADELDTGALRDIMERDKRRREKKRKADEERLRRRLERRAEKQRAATEVAPPAPGTPTTPRREAQGTIGLGIERNAPAPSHELMEDVQPSTPQRRPPPLASHFEENSQLPTPLESPIEEPVISNAQAVRYSRGSVSATHTRGPSNVSQMPELLSERLAHEIPVESIERAQDPTASGSLHAVETIDTVTTSKTGTNRRRSSEGRRMAIFASLFRRGKRQSQDQGRTTPSEVSFSNTSRESMSRHPLPAHLVALPPPPTAPIAIKRPSSVPRRTRSKFREDLPEFTPPDSRVQSPGIIHNSAIAARRRSQQPAGLIIESDSSGAARTDSPVSPGVPNAGLMSQSLASVDSEGSWLSGKPIKRSSNKSHLHSSLGSSTGPKTHEPFNASYEELGIPDDEYFRRLTPQPDEHRPSLLSNELQRKPSSEVMSPLETLEDDEAAPAMMESTEEQGELVHSSLGRQPTVVHRQARHKSTEGLLSFYNEDRPFSQETGDSAEMMEADSPTSDNEPVPVVQRARSVDLGKHHFRHLSAGSAKLLDIHKRTSTSSQNKLTHQE